MMRNQSSSSPIEASAVLQEHSSELARLFRFEGQYFVVKPATRRVLMYFDRAVLATTDNIPEPSLDPFRPAYGSRHTMPLVKNTPWHMSLAPSPKLVAAQDALVSACLLYPSFTEASELPNRVFMAILRACISVSEGPDYKSTLEEMRSPAGNDITSIAAVFGVPPHEMGDWTQEEFIRALAAAEVILRAQSGVTEEMEPTSPLPDKRGKRKLKNPNELALQNVQPVDLKPRKIDFEAEALAMAGG